jgi:CRISPR system Cascade subunit CasA
MKIKPAKENDEKAFTPLAKLDFSMASGSNPTLFDHEGANNGGRQFDNPQLALGLLTIQNFSTCGLLSRPLWHGQATPDSAKDAPCITSSMYHVFLVGINLMDTVCINICDFDELSRLMNGGQKRDWIGRPVWEQMPKNAADMSSTSTLLGRLTPLSRAIKLFEANSKMLYGEALRYEAYPDVPQEFNTSVAIRRSKKKEERYLVGAKLGIRPWRQLDAILQYNLAGNSMSHAVNLNHLDGEPIDIWVGALVRNPGKQDILDSVESRFRISKQFRSPEGCTVYAAEVQKAQSVARLLEVAVYVYRLALDPSEGTGLGSIATTHYWTTVEVQLSKLMAHIDSINTDNAEPTREAWRKMLYAAAREAYSLACGKETPRQLRAFAKGWAKLIAKGDEVESETAETKEVTV